MTAGELRQRYQEIGGDEARSRNREELIRRILWMLQAGVYGGLSERAERAGCGAWFRSSEQLGCRWPNNMVAIGRFQRLQLDA